VLYKMTKIRQEVLRAVTLSEKPATAEDIYTAMQGHANLASIYRALNWLEDMGYIKSVSFGTGPRYFFSKEKHYHFLFCKVCGRVQVITECPLNGYVHDFEERYGFTVSDHVLYFRGVCEECKKHGKRRDST